MSDTPSLDRLLRARRAVMHGRTRDGQLPPVQEDPYAQEIIDFARKLQRKNAALRAELEAARKDAERWHFVSGSMSHNHGPIQDGWTLNMLYPGDDPESAIDAAIAQGKGEK